MAPTPLTLLMTTDGLLAAGPSHLERPVVGSRTEPVTRRPYTRRQLRVVSRRVPFSAQHLEKLSWPERG